MNSCAFMRSYAGALVVLGLTGCAATRPGADLPRYPWTDAGAAMRLIERRDGTIETFSAECDLLIGMQGKRVALRSAVNADPPTRLRLQAFKLTSTVLDVTLNEDGLFVYHKKQSNETDSAIDRLSHSRFVAALTLLPGFDAGADWQLDADETAREFSISRSAPQEHATIQCFVDKATLTRTRCVYRDDDGEVRQTLIFGSYRPINDTVWPMHLEIRGAFGDVDLGFDRIDVNEALSARAFRPPRRAVKQP